MCASLFLAGSTLTSCPFTALWRWVFLYSWYFGRHCILVCFIFICYVSVFSFSNLASACLIHAAAALAYLVTTNLEPGAVPSVSLSLWRQLTWAWLSGSMGHRSVLLQLAFGFFFWLLVSVCTYKIFLVQDLFSVGNPDGVSTLFFSLRRQTWHWVCLVISLQHTTCTIMSLHRSNSLKTVLSNHLREKALLEPFMNLPGVNQWRYYNRGLNK